jgi:outer membrane protein TolC
MSVTADIAGKTLNKGVVAIRSEEDEAAARAEVERLLKRPLTVDPVQTARLNNPGLQAADNELGIAEAVRVQQSLPPNPHFSVTRMTGSVETEIERQIVANILALATLPVRSEIAAERFHQAQLAAALETLRVAAEARRAFYRAVAAQETVGLFTQANEAAETMTQLAKRLGETGAMNKLDQAREQAFHSDVAVRLASAQQRASRERERLVRALGLWGNDLKFALPKSLPPLPKRALALPAAEQEATPASTADRLKGPSAQGPHLTNDLVHQRSEALRRVLTKEKGMAKASRPGSRSRPRSSSTSARRVD